MILFVTNEIAPFSRVSGLSEIARSLPKALANLGNKVSIVTPYYAFININQLTCVKETMRVELSEDHVEECSVWKTEHEGVDVYFIRHDTLLSGDYVSGSVDDEQRFALFAKAVQQFMDTMDLNVKVLHSCNWVGAKLNTLLSKEKSFKKKLLTLMIQGSDMHMSKEKISVLKSGAKTSDVVIVYGEETPSYLKKPDSEDVLAGTLKDASKSLRCISPAIDYDIYHPGNDGFVEYPFHLDTLKERPKNKAFLQKTSGLKSDKSAFVVGVVTSMHQEKGGDLLLDVIPGLMDLGVQVKALVDGDEEEVEALRLLASKHPKQFSVTHGFDDKLARQIYAGSDVMLIPSRYGYSVQSAMKALAYGSIPIVRDHGAFKDVCEDYNPNREQGNCFMFAGASHWQLFAAVVRAKEASRFTYDFHSIVEAGMEARFFYHETAKQCVDIYREGLRKKLGIEDEDEEELDA